MFEEDRWCRPAVGGLAAAGWTTGRTCNPGRLQAAAVCRCPSAWILSVVAAACRVANDGVRDDQAACLRCSRLCFVGRAVIEHHHEGPAAGRAVSRMMFDLAPRLPSFPVSIAASTFLLPPPSSPSAASSSFPTSFSSSPAALGLLRLLCRLGASSLPHYRAAATQARPPPELLPLSVSFSAASLSAAPAASSAAAIRCALEVPSRQQRQQRQPGVRPSPPVAHSVASTPPLPQPAR